MTESQQARTLEEDLLARAAEDWVSAAEVIDLVRRAGPSDPVVLRDLSVGLVARLLVQGLVLAGDVGDVGHTPWEGGSAKAIERIVTTWASAQDPFVMPGEIFWLDTTPEGQRAGELVWAREES